MKMYQDNRRLDFHALDREIKRKREAKGWTQEYLAQLVDRTPRSIMYFENRGQHPSLNVFYKLVTLLVISVDQFFYPDRQNVESTCRKHIDHLLNEMNGKELTIMKSTAEGLQKVRRTEEA
jgi:transcriptional regulator with XRE-family HTH domain